jgi:hypothetical protein
MAGRGVIRSAHTVFEGLIKIPVLGSKMVRICKVSWRHLVEYGLDIIRIHEFMDCANLSTIRINKPCFQGLVCGHPH